MSKTILLKRSNVVVDGNPKAPNAAQLEFGEVAVNYSAGNESIFIKNGDGEVVGTYINGNFQTATEALALHSNRTDNPHGVNKSHIGLSNVDNTADIDKPISTAQAAALAEKLERTAITDSLDSTSTTIALSAAAGKELARRAAEASGGATDALDDLVARMGVIENEWQNEFEDTLALADGIIAKEQALKVESTPNYDTFV